MLCEVSGNKTNADSVKGRVSSGHQGAPGIQLESHTFEGWFVPCDATRCHTSKINPAGAAERP